jgi:hypothetical protein
MFLAEPASQLSPPFGVRSVTVIDCARPTLLNARHKKTAAQKDLFILSP